MDRVMKRAIGTVLAGGPVVFFLSAAVAVALNTPSTFQSSLGDTSLVPPIESSTSVPGVPTLRITSNAPPVSHKLAALIPTVPLSPSASPLVLTQSLSPTSSMPTTELPSPTTPVKTGEFCKVVLIGQTAIDTDGRTDICIVSPGEESNHPHWRLQSNSTTTSPEPSPLPSTPDKAPMTESPTQPSGSSEKPGN